MIAAGLSILALASAAVGPSDRVAAHESPKIVTQPDADQMATFYPERATRLQVRGDATIACTSSPMGVLTDCKVTHEWPEGFYFGEAALKLSSFFRLSGEGPYTAKLNFQFPHEDTLRIDRLDGGAFVSETVKILSQPSDDDIAAAYTWPGSAVTGVSLLCAVTKDGTLENCVSVGNALPEALGAALKMAARYRITPPSDAFVGGRVNVFFTFVPRDPDQTTPPLEVKEPDGL